MELGAGTEELGRPEGGQREREASRGRGEQRLGAERPARERRWSREKKVRRTEVGLIGGRPGRRPVRDRKSVV